MLNKGVGGKGFTICCDCGAAMPGDDPVVLKDVLRPYRSKFNKTRCSHADTDNVNLSYDFVTDMLVLEFTLDRHLIDVNSQRNSWLNRAGQSLSEALRLAVCQELDIEFTELVTGYRVRHNQDSDFADVYLTPGTAPPWTSPAPAHALQILPASVLQSFPSKPYLSFLSFAYDLIISKTVNHVLALFVNYVTTLYNPPPARGQEAFRLSPLPLPGGRGQVPGNGRNIPQFFGVFALLSGRG